MKPIPYKPGGFVRKKKKRNNSQLSLQFCNIHLYRTENFLVSFNLNLATNHRGNDVSTSGGYWTAWRWRRGGAEPRLARVWDSWLLSWFAHPSGWSGVGLLSRLTGTLEGLMLRKEYSRGVGGKWGPLTLTARQQNSYKVSTLELSVNVKTFCLRNMTPYAAATTLFANIKSDSDGP